MQELPFEKQEKNIAIVSYIILIGAFVAMRMNRKTKSDFASFHIRQGLGLSVVFIILGAVVVSFDNNNVTFPMWIFISVLWSYGIISAIKGQQIALPLLGSLFQNIFRKIR